MQRFDASEYGVPGEIIEVVIRFKVKKPEIPSPDRQLDQWQPLGAVVRRVVARLGEQDGDANG
jgi:hypothetical protein